MKRIIVLTAGLIVLLLMSFLKPTEISSSHSSSKPKLYPIKGKILVSFKQDRSEADYFTWNGKKIKSRLSGYTLNTLKSFGLKRCGKAYHRNGRAIYSMDFGRKADDETIVQYLKSLSEDY